MKSNNPRGCSKLALFWECCFCIHNEPQSGRPPFEMPMQSSEHAANVWLDGTGHSDTCPIDPLCSDEPQHHVVLSACLSLVAQHSTVKRECGRCLALAVQGGSSRAHAEHQTSKIVSSQVAFQNGSHHDLGGLQLSCGELQPLSPDSALHCVGGSVSPPPHWFKKNGGWQQRSQPTTMRGKGEQGGECIAGFPPNPLLSPLSSPHLQGQSTGCPLH